MVKSSMRPGVVSSKKMNDLMKQCMKKSITKKNQRKLDLILKGAEYLELLSFHDSDSEMKSHFSAIVESTSFSKAMKKEKESAKITVRHFFFEEVVFDILYEFGIATRNCISGDYKNVKKSIRWIVETVLFWSYFQASLGKSQVIYQNILRDYSDDETDKILMLAGIQWNFRSRFEERLEIKKEYGKPTLPELINDLNKLKTDSINLNDLQKTLRNIYKTSSGYLHISYQTLREYSAEELRGDYAFFQSYEFSQSQFDSTLKELWEVLDITFAIMILTQTYFYNYNSPNELLKNETQYYDAKFYGNDLLNNTKVIEQLKYFSKIIK